MKYEIGLTLTENQDQDQDQIQLNGIKKKFV